MKNNLNLILLVLMLSSCKTDSENPPTISNPIPKIEASQEQQTTGVFFTVQQIDSLFNHNLLTQRSYPNMSSCGGVLYGYYYHNELKLIDSKYQAELGYSSKKVYWDGDTVMHIKYRQYFAEWGKYEEKYPSESIAFDPNKMTYSDTIYNITFEENYAFKKMAKNTVISTKNNTSLVKKLTDCAVLMKSELAAMGN